MMAGLADDPPPALSANYPRVFTAIHTEDNRALLIEGAASAA
jgi:hypothetical protein